MWRYILHRLGQGLLVICLLSVVVFFLAYLTGDPADLLLPMEATQEDKALFRQKWGLDQPLYVQYGMFAANALRGDFGVSYRGGRQVGPLLAQRLANSLGLVSVSTLLALVVGIPLGVVAAARKNSAVDYGARFVAVLGQSAPSFFIALVLMEVFAVRLALLPTSEMGSLAHYVLPVTTLAWLTTAGILRLVRSSMLDVLDSDYVKLARIKGVSETRVIWKHALRNALVPVITFAGVQFAVMIAAAVVVEVVFAWPGMGRFAYEAVQSRDFPVLRAVILTISAIVVAVNLAVDVLYAYIDPRIRYG